MRGMGSTFHPLCLRYSGSLTLLPLWLLAYRKPLPFLFQNKAYIIFDINITVVLQKKLNYLWFTLGCHMDRRAVILKHKKGLQIRKDNRINFQKYVVTSVRTMSLTQF